MILGLKFPPNTNAEGHNSGAAILSESGQIIFASEEERFSRIKIDGGFPLGSMKSLLRNNGITPEDIDYVAYPTICRFDKFYRGAAILIPRSNYISALRFASEILGRERDNFFQKQDLVWEGDEVIEQKDQGNGFPKNRKEFLKYFGLYRSKAIKIDHHLAHAAAAYFTSGWQEALVITLDGWGALLSGTIYEGENGTLKKITQIYGHNSLGLFWELVTTICGFHYLRHGGKITGLAAYGNPNGRCYDYFRKIVLCSGLQIRTHLPNIMRLKKILQGIPREDIAAAAQRRLEEVVVQLVKNIMKVTRARKIALAGGVFSNVKLNQRIREIEGIENVYIFPEMGDGGLTVGAALAFLSKMKRLQPFTLENVYWGPRYSTTEMEEALKKAGVSYRYIESPQFEDEIAQLLINGKVVARFNGRMEYGPRALGNRSILYQTIDSTVNDWLNARLKRTEFMPFAPVTLKEYAKTCYIGYKPEHEAARYMTITYDCTDWMKRVSPAVVHVDGTARPQVIAEQDNPSYHRILKKYYEKTGIPSLINTSFNMHEEPIVCSPVDAIRAFKVGHLDYLAMGNFLTRNSEI